eukprot:1159775-Pelagomonas_calceolata.AAC.2
MLEWQQTHIPELVHDTGSVDVVLSACSTRHAALVSRAGELYTWGYGKGEGRTTDHHRFTFVRRWQPGARQLEEPVQPSARAGRLTNYLLYVGSPTITGSCLRADGNLGHGSLKSLSSPRRVLGGWVPKGEGVRGLSCSDGCTAAVTSDGSL